MLSGACGARPNALRDGDGGAGISGLPSGRPARHCSAQCMCIAPSLITHFIALQRVKSYRQRRFPWADGGLGATKI